MRLLLASPSYGPVDPRAAKSLRVAMMNSAARGHVWVGDASPERQLITPARNAAVFCALQAPELLADGIVWVDNDILLPADGISHLLSHELDFVSGIYFQRLPPHWPLIALYKDNHFSWISSFPEKNLIKVDGFGFGICYTSIRMIKSMFDKIPEIADNGCFEYNETSRKCPHCRKETPRGFSEDLHFCLQAKRAGFQAYVDTAVLCGHLGESEEVRQEHHEDWKKEVNFKGEVS